MANYDVTIVGGGPIGAAAARSAAATGARTLLLEQRDGSGEPARCTGLVSPRTFDVLGVSTESLLREIRGGRLHSPGGKTLGLRSETTKALVVDRGHLNRELIQLAQTAGVELRTHTQVIAAGSGYLTISHEEKRERIGSTVIIGADGPRSAVASWFNLPSPTHFLTAHQAIVAGEPYAADEVEIFFGSRVAPGFFAWVVPAETGCLRIGLASPPKTATDALLPLFLAKHFPGRVLEHITGRIPLGFPMLTVGNGVLLVGDAAGQVKPTSGGGLYTGGVCAKIAGEVAGYVALTGKATAEALSLYEHRWRREIGEELRAGLMIHRAFASLSDQEIDAIFTVLDDPAILHTIAENGDIDYPSRLIPSFLSHRHLWPRLLSFIPALGGWQRIEKLAQAAFAPNNCPPL